MLFCRALITVFAASALSLGTAAQAEQWQTTDVTRQSFIVNSGSLYSLALPASMSINKLLVQAESVGSQNAYFDVIVNGDVKGTIMTPGVDPTYIVTIDETTTSIQFRSNAGGAFRILRVLAVAQHAPFIDGHPSIGHLLPNTSQMTDVAVGVIDLIRRLEPEATPEEQILSLLPIKAAAGRLYAVAAARGPSSQQTRQAAIDVIATIDAGRSYFDEQMKKDGSFDCIVDLLTLRANLDAMID